MNAFESLTAVGKAFMILIGAAGVSHLITAVACLRGGRFRAAAAALTGVAGVLLLAYAFLWREDAVLMAAGSVAICFAFFAEQRAKRRARTSVPD